VVQHPHQLQPPPENAYARQAAIAVENDVDALVSGLKVIGGQSFRQRG